MIITLTTDFGIRDTYVAEVKGRILKESPGVTIVDVMHGISPGDTWEAAYHLLRIIDAFPAGTIHLVVVDPGVGSERAILVGESESARVIVPDNGIITFVRSRLKHLYRFVPADEDRTGVSATFHGRDLFAPLAARLARGAVRDGELVPYDEPVLLGYTPPGRCEAGWEGMLLHVDRFGNGITDIPCGEPGGRLESEGWCVDRWHRTYAEAPEGVPFLLCGSMETVEISVRGGSAADHLNLTVGTRILLRFPEDYPTGECESPTGSGGRGD